MFELYGYEDGEITKERFEEVNNVKLETIIKLGHVRVDYGAYLHSDGASLTLKEFLWLLDQVRRREVVDGE